MKIIQILQTENNYSWQGAILGLGDDGVLYELSHDYSGWRIITEPVVLTVSASNAEGRQ